MLEILKLVLKLFGFAADEKVRSEGKTAGANEVIVQAQGDTLDALRISKSIKTGDVPLDGKLADWVRTQAAKSGN